MGSNLVSDYYIIIMTSARIGLYLAKYLHNLLDDVSRTNFRAASRNGNEVVVIITRCNQI